eukprot:199681_1
MALNNININVDVESLKKSMLSDKGPPRVYSKPAPSASKPYVSHHAHNPNPRRHSTPSSAQNQMHRKPIQSAQNAKEMKQNDPKSKSNELDAPSMNEIQSRQRLNQQKAKAIQQSLLERQKRLEQEQAQLKSLNAEFESMENKLSKDVETLRGLIETINRDLAYYQSDFEWKKQQYETSKAFMDKLKERRQNLTKHLHTIIASNEQIKAGRMQELMSKLEKMKMGNKPPPDPFGGFDDKQ